MTSASILPAEASWLQKGSLPEMAPGLQKCNMTKASLGSQKLLITENQSPLDWFLVPKVVRQRPQSNHALAFGKGLKRFWDHFGMPRDTLTHRLGFLEVFTGCFWLLQGLERSQGTRATLLGTLGSRLGLPSNPQNSAGLICWRFLE